MYSGVMDSMLQLLQLEVYNAFHVNATSSTHGGVITYVQDTYDVTIKTWLSLVLIKLTIPSLKDGYSRILLSY